jgi:hypothetical protein
MPQALSRQAALSHAAPSVEISHLGEATCVVSLGADAGRFAAASADELAVSAAAEGCADFVFDLTALRRYEVTALWRLADLWQGLSGFGYGVLVAAGDPGVVGTLRRALGEDAELLRPTVADALRSLLARPV